MTVLEASAQDTSAWHVGHYDQYLAQTTRPFDAIERNDDALFVLAD
jgi:hypothetical protein